MANKNNHQYEDIISLPHHVSATRPQMPMEDRAAQFSPFAALTGYDSAILETQRLTDSRVELDECEKTEIDLKLQRIADRPDTEQEVTVTYFVPDARKSGGAYVDVSGTVKNIDRYDRMMLLRDGTQIPIDNIRDIRLGICGSSSIQSCTDSRSPQSSSRL